MSKIGQKFITNKKVIAELRRLYDSSNGKLDVEDIVRAAKDKRSPLHKHFEWDDSLAAKQYRLWQARKMLQITVEYIIAPDGEKYPSRVFASLSTDREQGGYRSVVDIMSDREMKRQMLTDALNELERIRLRYAQLKELAEVFSAIAKARRRVA